MSIRPAREPVTGVVMSSKLREAGEALLAYAPPYRSRDLIEHRGGFSGAVIFQVDAPSRRYCLRGWPPGGLPQERIRGLHRLLRSVCEAGVTQVAVPIAALDGDTLVRVGGRDWHLEPWMPGRSDYRENPSDARLRAAMRCLARWHRAAARFEPSSIERQWFCRCERSASPAVVERLRLIYEWHAGRLSELKRAVMRRDDDLLAEAGRRIIELFEEVSSPVAGQLERAARLRFRLQPCLRDIRQDHVLFTGDEVTGLIDACACRMENVATDLARLLGDLVSDDVRAWGLGLDEYGRHQPLSESEMGLVSVLDRSGVLLSGLTWLDRHFLRGQAWGECEEVERRVRYLLSRLEFLASKL